MGKPPSLTATPNIPFEAQTLEQLGGCEVANVGNSCFQENRRADTALIMAAPEMLAVLERLLRLNREGNIMARVWGDAEAVVAKATDQ